MKLNLPRPIVRVILIFAFATVAWRAFSKFNHNYMDNLSNQGQIMLKCAEVKGSSILHLSHSNSSFSNFQNLNYFEDKHIGNQINWSLITSENDLESGLQIFEMSDTNQNNLIILSSLNLKTEKKEITWILLWDISYSKILILGSMFQWEGITLENKENTKNERFLNIQTQNTTGFSRSLSSSCSVLNCKICNSKDPDYWDQCDLGYSEDKRGKSWRRLTTIDALATTVTTLILIGFVVQILLAGFKTGSMAFIWLVIAQFQLIVTITLLGVLDCKYCHLKKCNFIKISLL